jgi:hypothetical protein
MDTLEHFDCLQLNDYAPPDNKIQTVKGNWPAAIENDVDVTGPSWSA